MARTYQKVRYSPPSKESEHTPATAASGVEQAFKFLEGRWKLGACPNSRCSILSESDSTFGYEQVFSALEYRSDAASAAECAGLRAERPCVAVYISRRLPAAM